ncbi:MAG: hypothetical protein M1829_003027 [Trizodia sp. TS-e1964]|nr:MAG: hypothetical protein M1829_003027 [Trizodia sp. TS-e1964]
MVCKLPLLGLLAQSILALAAPENILARQDIPQLENLNGCVGSLQLLWSENQSKERQAALPSLDRNGEIYSILPFGLFSISPSTTDPKSYDVDNVSPLTRANVNCGLNYQDIFSCRHSKNQLAETKAQITLADNFLTYRGIDTWAMTEPTGSIPGSQLQLLKGGPLRVVCIRRALSALERNTIDRLKAARSDVVPQVEENKKIMELPAFSMGYQK